MKDPYLFNYFEEFFCPCIQNFHSDYIIWVDGLGISQEVFCCLLLPGGVEVGKIFEYKFLEDHCSLRRFRRTI